MRFLSLMVAALLLVFASSAMALNENTTIVLHARDGFADCSGPQQAGLDCVNVHPTIDVTGMAAPWVFVMLRNYDQLAGLQCAFDWPSTWTFLAGTWDCQPGSAISQFPKAPGPKVGTLAVVFDCVQNGSLITIGRMIFASAGTGCLSIIESDLAFGTHVAECDGGDGAAIPPANRGRVCVGVGGYDACWLASTPVESATWGAIKSQYR
jgi:hypothetical protein